MKFIIITRKKIYIDPFLNVKIIIICIEKIETLQFIILVNYNKYFLIGKIYLYDECMILHGFICLYNAKI